MEQMPLTPPQLQALVLGLPWQKTLFDEAVDADLAALEAQLAELMAAKRKDTEPAPERPKRAALPPHLPRVERHHEPRDTTCPCGCQMTRIGEDVSEKLDYTPGSFTVERHVRGKWACAKCRTLTQAPVPAEIIDKGLPTSGLLAHVLVAKHSDHLPLYRQEAIFERAGLAIPRSTLAAWVGVCGVRLQPLVDAMKADLLRLPVLHADETPVAMLAPGTGKTHRAYLSEDRLRERRTRAAPVAQALHKWLLESRPKVPDGSATAKAMDYSLHRWVALTRYLGDPALPIDNNFYEQQIRPWATGHKELAVRWNAAGWPAGRRHHELDPDGQAQRA
jgi:transposase